MPQRREPIFLHNKPFYILIGVYGVGGHSFFSIFPTRKKLGLQKSSNRTPDYTIHR